MKGFGYQVALVGGSLIAITAPIVLDELFLKTRYLGLATSALVGLKIFTRIRIKAIENEIKTFYLEDSKSFNQSFNQVGSCNYSD